MTGKTIDVIYDGDCGFCVRSLEIVRALDVWQRLRFHQSQNPETFARFPALRDADVEDAMYAVVDGELPHRGFFAFRRLLWSSPLMWPLLLVFYFPGASFVGPRLYAWVARNRKRFGCESNVCAPSDGPGTAAQFKE